MSKALRILIEPVMKWKSLAKHRMTAGLAYESTPWQLGGLPNRTIFEWADGIALREWWIFDDRLGTERRAVDSQDMPLFRPPSWAAIEGAAAESVLAKLVGQTGGLLLRQRVRVDDSASCYSALRELFSDHNEMLAVGRDSVTKEKRLQLGLRSKDLSVFAQRVESLHFVVRSRANELSTGFILYGGNRLGEAIKEAADLLGKPYDIVDPENDVLDCVVKMPSLDEINADEGNSVIDVAGYNVAQLPSGQSAQTVDLSATAIVNLGPMASWTNLVKLGLSHLSLRSLAPIPTCQLEHIELSGTESKLDTLSEGPLLRSIRVETGRWDDLSCLTRFPSLVSVCLELESLKSLGGIEELEHLEELDLSVSELPNLELLGELKKLHTLRVRCNGAFDASILPDASLEQLSIGSLSGRQLLLRSPESLARIHPCGR